MLQDERLFVFPPLDLAKRPGSAERKAPGGESPFWKGIRKVIHTRPGKGTRPQRP